MTKQHQLKKMAHDKIDEIIQEIELPEECSIDANSLADTQIISQLIQEELYDEAIKFLALGLPKREAIWWGYICSQELEKSEQQLDVQNALRVIHEWIQNSSEELRISAKAFADKLALYTPSSWVAMAIFWSGGSLAPKGKPPIEPEPFMSGYAVANGLILAAEKSEHPLKKKKLFIKRGLHIAMGGNGKIAV